MPSLTRCQNVLRRPAISSGQVYLRRADRRSFGFLVVLRTWNQKMLYPPQLPLRRAGGLFVTGSLATGTYLDKPSARGYSILSTPEGIMIFKTRLSWLY